VTAAPVEALAPIRRLPVPVSEPYAPLTPARPVTVPPTQGALALAFTAVQPPPERKDRWAGPQPTPSSRLPDPQQTCTALVQAVVEVLSGTRQPTQLVRWLSADVYTALQRRAALAARLRSGGRTQVAPGPVRRPVANAVRLCHPADGVVEASAVVVDRDRVRAVAVRLEGLDGRWRATALEVG
jgi:hypothetical protein